MPISYRKTYEVGPWYEVKTLADVIRSKQSKGEPVDFELSLLESWQYAKGYEMAADVLKDLKNNHEKRTESKSSGGTPVACRNLPVNQDGVQDGRKQLVMAGF